MEVIYSRLRMGILSRLFLLVALPLLSTAKETGDGGGAGGMPSTSIFEGLMFEAVMTCAKEARASWVVGGATETDLGAAEMVVILIGRVNSLKECATGEEVNRELSFVLGRFGGRVVISFDNLGTMLGANFKSFVQ